MSLQGCSVCLRECKTSYSEFACSLVSWITHIRFDEPVARVPRVANQFAYHVSLFGAPEYIQSENERHYKSGQREVFIYHRCGVDSTDSRCLYVILVFCLASLSIAELLPRHWYTDEIECRSLFLILR